LGRLGNQALRLVEANGFHTIWTLVVSAGELIELDGKRFQVF